MTCPICNNAWKWPDIVLKSNFEMERKPDKNYSSDAEIRLYLAIGVVVGLGILIPSKVLRFPLGLMAFFIAYSLASSLLQPFFYKQRLKKFYSKPCVHGVAGGITDGRCPSCVHAIVVLKKENERRYKLEKDANEMKNEELRRLVNIRLNDRDKWYTLDPHRFEEYIGEIFHALGYQVQIMPFTGDGGKDLIVSKNNKKYLVECKRYKRESPVGRPLIQQFLGAITEEKADGGYFVTTSRFTQGMDDYVQNKPIILIDGDYLEQLVDSVFPESKRCEYKVICSECGLIFDTRLEVENLKCREGHEIKHLITKAEINSLLEYRMDHKQYHQTFKCNRCNGIMVLRNGQYGRFLGCSNYPLCKNTRSIF